MKKLFAVTALLGLLLLPRSAWSYEIKENPDRKMSFGFNYSRVAVGGDYNYLSIHFPNAGTDIQSNFVGDVRIPLSQYLTFMVGGGYSTTSLGLNIINKDERWDMSGYNVNAGFRLYMP